jgi:ribosomal protein S14
MSLRIQIKKELDSRFIYKNLELKQKVLKVLINNVKLPAIFKRKIMFKLHLLQNMKKSISFFTRFCISSGRTRGVYRFFKLARSSIKRFYVAGYLPAIQKSS